MASLFARLKAGLAKTAQQIRERLNDATSGAAPAPAAARTAIDVESIEAMEDALIAADVGLPATTKILQLVRAETKGSIRERVALVIKRLLTDVPVTPMAATSPHVVLIVGVNGTGKTTTVGKLAHYYRASGRSV